MSAFRNRRRRRSPTHSYNFNLEHMRAPMEFVDAAGNDGTWNSVLTWSLRFWAGNARIKLGSVVVNVNRPEVRDRCPT